MLTVPEIPWLKRVVMFQTKLLAVVLMVGLVGARCDYSPDGLAHYNGKRPAWSLDAAPPPPPAPKPDDGCNACCFRIICQG